MRRSGPERSSEPPDSVKRRVPAERRRALDGRERSNRVGGEAPCTRWSGNEDRLASLGDHRWLFRVAPYGAPERPAVAVVTPPVAPGITRPQWPTMFVGLPPRDDLGCRAAGGCTGALA